MEKRITLIKNFISIQECDVIIQHYTTDKSKSIDFLNKKIKNYLKEIKHNYSDINISEIQFNDISIENTTAIFLKESKYDITFLIGLNSNFEGGRFIFLNKEINKNMHMNNSPGDMIGFFSNIEYGNGKIINGTKYYLKISINNILNLNSPKSLI